MRYIYLKKEKSTLYTLFLILKVFDSILFILDILATILADFFYKNFSFLLF